MNFGENPDRGQWVQAVRVIDVVALGPAMVYAAHRATELAPALRLFLGISGAATVVFNGVNFVRALRDVPR